MGYFQVRYDSRVVNYDHKLFIRLATENTNCKGRYHCTADLLCILFEFRCFAYVELASTLPACSNPNQSNRRSAVQ